MYVRVGWLLGFKSVLIRLNPAGATFQVLLIVARNPNEVDTLALNFWHKIPAMTNTSQ